MSAVIKSVTIGEHTYYPPGRPEFAFPIGTEIVRVRGVGRIGARYVVQATRVVTGPSGHAERHYRLGETRWSTPPGEWHERDIVERAFEAACD